MKTVSAAEAAAGRFSQRQEDGGVPPLVVNWLLEYGRTRYDHKDGIIHFFDKHSRRDLEQAVGRRVISRLSDYLNSYIVLSTVDDVIITVGHRYRRLHVR